VENHQHEIRTESSLRPRYFEWEFGKKMPPLTLKLKGGRTASFAGRIDRIDVDETQKRFLVIDYKTGPTKTTGAQVISGEVL
jgi:ATP-dependent helicase/DNAse subunit B